MPELHAIVPRSLPDTRAAIEAALKAEGFGVLTEVGGGTEVKILDPQQAFTLTAPATRVQLEPLASGVGDMLARALAAVRAS